MNQRNTVSLLALVVSILAMTSFSTPPTSAQNPTTSFTTVITTISSVTTSTSTSLQTWISYSTSTVSYVFTGTTSTITQSDITSPIATVTQAIMQTSTITVPVVSSVERVSATVTAIVQTGSTELYFWFALVAVIIAMVITALVYAAKHGSTAPSRPTPAVQVLRPYLPYPPPYSTPHGPYPFPIYPGTPVPQHPHP